MAELRQDNHKLRVEVESLSETFGDLDKRFASNSSLAEIQERVHTVDEVAWRFDQTDRSVKLVNEEVIQLKERLLLSENSREDEIGAVRTSLTALQTSITADLDTLKLKFEKLENSRWRPSFDEAQQLDDHPQGPDVVPGVASLQKISLELLAQGEAQIRQGKYDYYLNDSTQLTFFVRVPDTTQGEPSVLLSVFPGSSYSGSLDPLISGSSTEFFPMRRRTRGSDTYTVALQSRRDVEGFLAGIQAFLPSARRQSGDLTTLTVEDDNVISTTFQGQRIEFRRRLPPPVIPGIYKQSGYNLTFIVESSGTVTVEAGCPESPRPVSGIFSLTHLDGNLFEVRSTRARENLLQRLSEACPSKSVGEMDFPQVEFVPEGSSPLGPTIVVKIGVWYVWFEKVEG
ncbi:hypothetical protein FOZ63_026203 [Perkinsus olseni]|uniref:Uncharacterized protein n=2 Tax=Perkinsus olseni TaxID=32597 RepID=A0A7J6SQP2_PEROL|nr:hypothetical protein FOZ63_026203 [Perkinsus olseni]